MPGKMLASSVLCKRAMRFSRSSSFTWRVRKRSSEKAVRRSSPSVRGRLMKTPRTILYWIIRGFETRGSYEAAGSKVQWGLKHDFIYSPNAGPEALLHPSAHVAVTPGRLTGAGGAMEVGDDGFEISDKQR